MMVPLLPLQLRVGSVAIGHREGPLANRARFEGDRFDLGPTFAFERALTGHLRTYRATVERERWCRDGWLARKPL